MISNRLYNTSSRKRQHCMCSICIDAVLCFIEVCHDEDVEMQRVGEMRHNIGSGSADRFKAWLRY